MKSLLVAIMLAVSIAFPALAKDVFTLNHDELVVVFTDAKCTSKKVKALVKADPNLTMKEMYTAKVTYKGKKIAACYGKSNGLIVVVGEDGNGTIIHPAAVELTI